jgi:hypothetical protein
MRDRLIELLKNNSHLDVLFGDEWEKAADELLANGVIVPPFVAGETVWCLEREGGTEPAEVLWHFDILLEKERGRK